MDRFEFLTDVTPAAWIGPRLHPFLQDTGSVVPTGFDAYCRIFHPVDGERWHDIAARNGRVAHPEMQLHCIDHPPGTPRPERTAGVATGSLPTAESAALVALLRPFTTGPDHCWFAIWEGFGGLDDQGVSARVELPHRRYLLAGGPVDLATANALDQRLEQSPNLWWPGDRAWIVATEIDYAWTYVGGTRALVDAVIADGRLEALPARLTDLPFSDGDTVNTS